MTTLRTTGGLLVLLVVAGAGCGTTQVSSRSDSSLEGMRFRNAAVVVSPDTGPSFEAARRAGETSLVRLLPELDLRETYQVLPAETLLDPASTKRWVTERGYDGVLFVRHDSSTSKSLPALEGVDAGSVHRVTYSACIWDPTADREVWSARIERGNAALTPEDLEAVARIVAKELRKARPRTSKPPGPLVQQTRVATLWRR